MTAYVIVDVTVLDADRYVRYRDLAQSIVEAFGGKYLKESN
jgi:uncharacterized protein (DUF1330 family)